MKSLHASSNTAPTRCQAGFTVVQLLVGLTIGLFITAAAASMLGSTLRGVRSEQREMRLMNELRSAADVITRDLRRAGHWGDAGAGVWVPGAASVRTNPYTALSPAGAASDAAALRYSRDTVENHAVDSNEQFGFRLRRGVVEMQLGAGNWQALTDAGTLTVTEFTISPQLQSLALPGLCAQACAAGSTNCPPRLDIRSLALRLSARSVGDAAVVRSLHGNVRLRNDEVSGACPS